MLILEKVQAQYLMLKQKIMKHSRTHFMQLHENLENVKVSMCERRKVQNSESFNSANLTNLSKGGDVNSLEVKTLKVKSCFKFPMAKSEEN